MEEKKAMPITYEQLKQEMAESGRRMTLSWSTAPMPWPPPRTKASSAAAANHISAHPLSVARILVELGMDSESVAAALMHDVAEDTAVSIDEIRQKFGAQVALLVDGVTKLTQITFSNVEDRQAENLRKMLLAMSQDVRVMIIKLCEPAAQHAHRRRLAGTETARQSPRDDGGLRAHRTPSRHLQHQGRT